MRLLLAAMMLAAGVVSAPAADLTAWQVRTLLSAAGVNLGTVRQIDGRNYMLVAVSVASGVRNGDFIVRLRVVETRRAAQ